MSEVPLFVSIEAAESTCGVLRSEIAAFYAGFGQPEVLRTAFLDAVLVVGMSADGRLVVSEFGGVDWVCAFTSVEEFARYMTARGVPQDRDYRYHTLLGRRIVEEFTPRCTRPTGVVIDVAGAAPMAFPPVVVSVEEGGG